MVLSLTVSRVRLLSEPAIRKISPQRGLSCGKKVKLH